MTLRYYFDEHIPRAITIGLRLRGVDILTAQEDLADGRADSDLLDRAAVLGRIVFTHDTDFLRIAAERITSATPFAGVVFAYPLDVTGRSRPSADGGDGQVPGISSDATSIRQDQVPCLPQVRHPGE